MHDHFMSRIYARVEKTLRAPSFEFGCPCFLRAPVTIAMIALAAAALTALVVSSSAQTLSPPAREPTDDNSFNRLFDTGEVGKRLLDQAKRLTESDDNPRPNTPPTLPMIQIPPTSNDTKARNSSAWPRATELPSEEGPSRRGPLAHRTPNKSPADAVLATPVAAFPPIDVQPPESLGQITSSTPAKEANQSYVPAEVAPSNMAKRAFPQVGPTNSQSEPIAPRQRPYLAGPSDREKRAVISNDASLQMDSDIRLLIERAEAKREQGDILGARIFLERASRNGNAAALRMLAETYDAHSLVQWGVRGVVPDDARAQQLYDLARRETEAGRIVNSGSN